MSVEIIEIISLVIKIAAVFVVYKLLKNMIDRIETLEKEVENLNDGLHYAKEEARGYEPMFQRRDDLFEQLTNQLDKKITWGWTKSHIIDLTESEKIANKLRQEADELEREPK